jgi:hypothetical protein
MPINTDKSAQVWAVLPKDKYNELRQLAEQQQRSISKQAAYIILQYLDKQPKPKK